MTDLVLMPPKASTEAENSETQIEVRFRVTTWFEYSWYSDQ